MRRAVCSATGSFERKLSLASHPISRNVSTCGVDRTRGLWARVNMVHSALPVVNLVPKRFSSQYTEDTASPPDEAPPTSQNSNPDSSEAPRNPSTKATKKSSSKESSTPGGTTARPKWSGPRRYPPRKVQLTGRMGNLVNFAPSSAHIPVDTSLPLLVWADGKPINRYNSLFRPPYLTERLAPHLDVRSDDPYLLSRTIELFGRSGISDWVAVLSEKMDKATVRLHVSEFLAMLPWEDSRVLQLRDAAWAEHVEAMQNPRLKNGPDDYEAHPEIEVNAPEWPSDSESESNRNLGMSWSTSGERDKPSERNPAKLVNSHFPRPKLITRVHPWDTHFIVAFATPTARRAVLNAYAVWLRWRLLEAYRDREELGGIPVLPPVSRNDFGELTVGKKDLAAGRKELEAIKWAEQTGWRPEYRVRAYHAGRTRTGSGENEWYESTRMRKKRLTEEALAAEKKENE